VAQNAGSAGSAWFNVPYLPFGAENLKVFTDIDPNATEWIIRNGVNDKAQDGKTVFRKDSTPVRPWNDQDGEDGSNGNGAVAFKVIQTKEIDLTDVVPAPAAGAVPETAPREGYGGTVDWTLNEGKSTVRFDAETVYIAKVTLTPPAGAQFSGSGVTVSHRGGAVTVDPSSSATEVKVVVVFKATGALAYEAPFFSGSPSTLGDSVIDLIKKAKTESSGFLSLKLTSWDAETVNLDAAGTDIGAGLALTAADNSPPKVTIDGGGKEIALGSGNGSVITVGAGVTLTLKNITFKGTSGNTKPFIKVAAGGKLILEDGAVIKDNGKSGVLISGSNSVVEMYDGVRIEKNGQSGVAAERGGSFTMNGGTISGNTIANGGGGVDVFDGTFIKTGGIIYGNDVGAPLANTSNSSNAFKSHAVYFSFGITVKRRAGTAGEDVRLNGSTDEGWDIH
jgi:hypothetical protein